VIVALVFERVPVRSAERVPRRGGVRVEQQQQRRSLVLWGSGERPADVLYGTSKLEDRDETA